MSSSKEHSDTKSKNIDMEKILLKEIERVKNDTIISFDDYLKYFVGLRNAEEYNLYVSNLEKKKLYNFPDLYSVNPNKPLASAKANRKRNKSFKPILDIQAEIEPLASTNSLYMQIFKHIQIYKYNKPLYGSTIYDEQIEAILDSAKVSKQIEIKSFDHDVEEKDVITSDEDKEEEESNKK